MRPLHLAAALLSLALTLPAKAQAADCATAKAQVAALQSQLPIEVDAVTQTIAAAASCADKAINLQRTVALKLTRMEADFKDFLQKQDNDFVCTDARRRALADAGWTWSVRYTFQDGAPVTITASCN